MNDAPALRVARSDPPQAEQGALVSLGHGLASGKTVPPAVIRVARSDPPQAEQGVLVALEHGLAWGKTEPLVAKDSLR